MRHAVLLKAFAVLLTMSLFAEVAEAQATRTWVSGVGDDVNPCSRTAPCKTFAGAISKTAAGGEISTLDPGGFGAVTITKAISITNDNSGEAGILASGTNGIVVNVGPSDVVTLRGLVIDGAGTGINGINFIQAGTLRVQKSVIKNFRGAGGGFGIRFAPTGVGNLFVSETAITDNSKAAGTAGILVRPTGTGSANAVLNQISVENNNNGISVDGSATTTPVIEVLIRDSVSATNGGVGIAANAASGSAITRVMIDRSTTSHNVTGVLAQGTSVVLIGGTSVFGNQTGLSAVPGAQIFSYQTNQNNGNFVDNGAPTAVLSRQ